MPRGPALRKNHLRGKLEQKTSLWGSLQREEARSQGGSKGGVGAERLAGELGL